MRGQSVARKRSRSSFSSAELAPSATNMPLRIRVEAGDDPLGAGALGLVSQIGFVSAMVCIFYLLDCLYAERKDRSILFWKSLPVSDASTVLVKYAVAMVIVPLGVFLLSLLMYPTIYGIAALGVPQVSSASGGWSTARWLQREALMFGSMLVTLLWYAPLGAWAMLSSVVSRRSPFLIAVMPFVVAAICENIVLHSAHVWRFIGNRLRPAVHPLETLTEPALWIGLAVAAGMLYMVIRLRRYRDDT